MTQRLPLVVGISGSSGPQCPAIFNHVPNPRDAMTRFSILPPALLAVALAIGRDKAMGDQVNP